MSELDKKKLSRLFNSGKYGEAVEYLEQLTKESPDNGEVLAMLGFAYGHIPPEVMGGGEKSDLLDKSISTYRKALEAVPESVDYMRGLGRILWRRSRIADAGEKEQFLEESLSVFEKAYEKSGRDPDVLSFMINVKADLGKIDEVKQDLKKIAEEKSSPYGAYLNAAFRLDEGGEDELAGRYARKALDIADDKGRAGSAKKKLEEIAEDS